MTWSYSGDPSSSDRDQVRFLIGDTDANREMMSNEEIDFALTMNTDARGAAALCCDALVAKFSKEVDSSTGSISRSGSQLADQFRRLAGNLRSRAFVLPRFGGFSQSEKDTISEDSDSISPSFTVGMYDDEEAL